MKSQTSGGKSPKRGTQKQSKPAARKPRAAAKTAGSSSKTTRTTGSRKPTAAEADEAEAKTTTNLDEIKAWAEARGGKPVTVKGTAPEHQAGLLRIDFPGYSGEESFEPISWEDWYAKFEEKNLAFLYQERTKDGKESRFFKLVTRK